ncbi:cytochrome b6-f complex alternative Rieske iron sulfur protein PetC3 [Pseudanabaena sp. lw0831]|uniref:QcrA and Rieske domain-containing protein n=1 Tax=Pseudanabaena sp. lw0831 TaxID=1357935 RepID=UPI00191594CC|nr:Rieske (2Fe-2S) protein [Pseudanabaena sp. lw0831]GBO54984.1 cytochrome b6-f complex alternative Rieske iron sulfur protein PetC3 [Pseudanabaena sp. lw0831]
MNLNRRKLLSWFGLGWLASLLPSSLIGCSEANTPTASAPTSTSAPESVAAAPSGNFKEIGTVAQLDKDGALVSSDKKIAVVRNPNDATKVLAVNATCTHKGCTVAWKSANKEFVCPCHDAKFAADGAVRQGPADKPLQRYAAKIENGQVLVSA